MKLRISGNSIRLRLTQTEVSQLVVAGEVVSSCLIGANTFTYKVVKFDGSHITLDFENATITVSVPAALIVNWNLNDTVGFEATDENGLFILIEKDFVCLKPRINEDESDNYPNPQSIIDVYD